ncbi:MAG: phytanoyl-CoA dioxygenase family protein [Betaproteobacteria bacterium]|nr:phytanoyl-CoA dioxygenase family protein [Betaproteobacteria bacterium]
MNQTLFAVEDVARFERDGYAIVRGAAAPALLQRMRVVTQAHLAQPRLPVEYEADTHYPGAPASREAPGGRTVRRLLQAYARDAVFREWATSPFIAARLRQLLRDDVLFSQAHHNCIMTKHPAFSSVTGWHRDIRYWAFAKPELISVWLALGQEHRGNGCLSLLPGTHRMDFAADRLDAAQFLRDDVEANRALINTQVLAELNAGDVLFFHCRLFHAASQNHTSETKFSLVHTYRAAQNPPDAGSRSASLPDVPLAE